MGLGHDLAIAALALRQQGNISTVQLLALGVSRGGIVHRVRLGRLYREHRGVYSVGKPAATPLARASAAVLACGPGAALSHGSAMTLWGLQKRWSTPFDVVVATDRRLKGVRIHHSITLARRDVTTHLGVRVTTPARTLLDRARKLTRKQLTRAVNDALHSNYMRHADLVDVLDRNPNHPGHARLVSFIEQTTRGITRSELEDAFLELCKAYGLPQPQTNVRVAGYLVDAYFPQHGLIVELDSYEFHSDRTTFESDRNRDADTLETGLATVRITYERMKESPEREAARLDSILANRVARRTPQRGR